MYILSHSFKYAGFRLNFEDSAVMKTSRGGPVSMQLHVTDDDEGDDIPAARTKDFSVETRC